MQSASIIRLTSSSWLVHEPPPCQSHMHRPRTHERDSLPPDPGDHRRCEQCDKLATACDASRCPGHVSSALVLPLRSAFVALPVLPPSILHLMTVEPASWLRFAGAYPMQSASGRPFQAALFLSGPGAKTGTSGQILGQMSLISCSRRNCPANSNAAIWRVGLPLRRDQRVIRQRARSAAKPRRPASSGR